MNLKILKEAAHSNSVEKGFWDKENQMMTETPLELNKEISNNIVSTKLMLIVSELGEALEVLRKTSMVEETTKVLRYKDFLAEEGKDFDAEVFKEEVKDTFGDELADVIIRVLDLCGWMGIDIEFHLRHKMHYNKSRPYKHGKKF